MVLDFLFPERRRKQLREQEIKPDLRSAIEKNVAYFARLSPADRRELEGHVNVFLDEKKFEGCGGLQVTDEMRATIAAQACILLLHHEKPHYYPECDAILVYPSAYVAKRMRREGAVVIEDEQAVLGESHTHGIVVLSWDDVRRGAADVHDGQNVVFHEFAHQLDQEDGAADGAPLLERRSMYGPWARVLGKEFQALNDAIDHDRKSDIRDYAATNPAEFFAVITELFFEKPRQLRDKHPELYAQLSAFYRQDPAALDLS